MSESARRTTVDAEEIERFSRIADEWWNPHGKFAPLHRINPVRIAWIRDKITAHFGKLEGHSLLDIGCGGGLVAEPMARLGTTVTAIDASEKNIAVAKLHAEQSGLTIDYRCTTAEALTGTFDVVLALEIIEHVSDVEAFAAAICKLVKPGGILILSTLNRTPKSYALAIVGAEYILRWLPRGTHTWSKFLKPSEVHAHLRHNGMEVGEMTGMVMNPLTFKWEMNAKDVSVNYLLSARK